MFVEVKVTAECIASREVVSNRDCMMARAIKPYVKEGTLICIGTLNHQIGDLRFQNTEMADYILRWIRSACCFSVLLEPFTIQLEIPDNVVR